MLSLETKKLLGLQTTISNRMGSIPFVWDKERNQIMLTKKTGQRIYWLQSTTFLWIYNIGLVITYFDHYVVNSDPLPASEQIFHVFWMIVVPIGILLDTNTVIFKNELIFYINNTLNLDEQLQSSLNSNLTFG